MNILNQKRCCFYIHRHNLQRTQILASKQLSTPSFAYNLKPNWKAACAGILTHSLTKAYFMNRSMIYLIGNLNSLWMWVYGNILVNAAGNGRHCMPLIIIATWRVDDLDVDMCASMCICMITRSKWLCLIKSQWKIASNRKLYYIRIIMVHDDEMKISEKSTQCEESRMLCTTTRFN